MPVRCSLLSPISSCPRPPALCPAPARGLQGAGGAARQGGRGPAPLFSSPPLFTLDTLARLQASPLVFLCFFSDLHAEFCVAVASREERRCWRVTSSILFVSSCEQRTKLTPCFKTREHLRAPAGGFLLLFRGCSAVQAGWALLPGSPKRSNGELGRRVGDGQCCVSQSFAASLPGVSRVLPPPWVLEAPVSAGCHWLSVGLRGSAGAVLASVAVLTGSPGPVVHVVHLLVSLFPGRSDTEAASHHPINSQ